MKYGVREICNVVLKAKSANLKFGTGVFVAGQPVIYFDSLKTSSLDQAVTTVYAQGGRGNARLIAWDGDKVVTFTFEDALISPLGMSILAGSGMINASATNKVMVHNTVKVDNVTLDATAKTAVGTVPTVDFPTGTISSEANAFAMLVEDDGSISPIGLVAGIVTATPAAETTTITFTTTGTVTAGTGKTVIYDFYTEKTSGAKQINIKAESLAGNFYLEADTLFRDENGDDIEAQFVIPNIKIQSNFTFTMAPTGDPSTFTFTADAFPDYTAFDKTSKVIAALNIIEE